MEGGSKYWIIDYTTITA